MATVPRSPLFINKREVAPVHNLSQFVWPSLLVTVLAAPLPIPLPLSAAQALPLQVLSWPQITDTSRGTPKTLIAEARLPFNPAPHYPPARFFWQPQDVSAGIPKVLLPEKTLPFFTFSQPAPDLLRNVTDATRGTPTTLFPLPLPPGTSLQFSVVPDTVHAVFDTTHGTLAFQFPVALPPGFALQLAAPAYQFQVVNTSQASNAIYYPPTPVVSPPAGNAILWIVGPKGIKTKIRFISGTEPEKES